MIMMRVVGEARSAGRRDGVSAVLIRSLALKSVVISAVLAKKMMRAFRSNIYYRSVILTYSIQACDPVLISKGIYSLLFSIRLDHLIRQNLIYIDVLGVYD